MPESRITKKVFMKQPGGKRDVDRPRARGANNVTRDAQEIFGVRS